MFKGSELDHPEARSVAGVRSIDEHEYNSVKAQNNKNQTNFIIKRYNLLNSHPARRAAYEGSYGLNIFNFSSFIGLKCLALLEISVILFSTAVAAMIASPALIPRDKVYSSIYIKAR